MPGSQPTLCTHKGAGEGLRPFDPEGRPRSAEAVRGDRTGDAVRDGGTHRSLARQRRGKLGVQGGRSVPLARPQCLTLRGLAQAP